MPELPPNSRSVHSDYDALSAGAVLLGFGYALALSVPISQNFSADSRHLAVPIAGPWLTGVTWKWALDGVIQLGGVAFMVDAYANPITVLGTPSAQIALKTTANRGLNLTLRF